MTLQRQKKFPEFLKELIVESSPDILWIVRSHPKGKKFKINEFEEFENVYISEFVNACPVNQLYSMVDYNVSEGSATVLDAMYCGVVSIITSKEGSKNYDKEIREKKVLTAYDKESFFHIIRNSKCEDFRMQHFTKFLSLKGILENLLK